MTIVLPKRIAIFFLQESPCITLDEGLMTACGSDSTADHNNFVPLGSSNQSLQHVPSGRQATLPPLIVLIINHTVFQMLFFYTGDFIDMKLAQYFECYFVIFKILKPETSCSQVD